METSIGVIISMVPLAAVFVAIFILGHVHGYNQRRKENRQMSPLEYLRQAREENFKASMAARENMGGANAGE